MAKQREFASDSDVSRFITQKQNREAAFREEMVEENTPRGKRSQFTIYPGDDDMEQIKILAKLSDVNLNTMVLKLVRESLAREDHQRAIAAYRQMKANI